MNVDLVPDGRSAPPLGKVVLCFPRFSAPQYPVWLPMEIMTVATALWTAGYRVRVLDDRMEPETESILLREAENALFVGFSARPGDQVIRASELFSKLKREIQGTVTVFGGWFPTTFPKACLEIDTVDIVVRGQADTSVIELAGRLREGRDLDGLPGIWAKQDGRWIMNPRRPLEDIEDTPRVPFERFPIEQYVTFDQCLSYYSSRGCPASCRFCSVPCAYPSEWSGYAPQRVLDEMELLSKRYDVRLFKIHDTNFFADVERARAICKGFIERDLGIRWVADGRVCDILRFDDGMWSLLGASGCREIVTGGEAGSDKQLEFVFKECTSEEIYRAARLVTGRGINIRINFIVGLHGEGRKELLATLRLVDRLQALGELVKLQFYRYTPAPATDLGVETWKLKRRGHDGTVPHDAASIISLPINHDQAKLFWLSRIEEQRVKRLYYFYLPLVYYFRDPGRPGFRRWILKRLIAFARLRVRHGITFFPFEQWLCNAFNRRMPRSREFEWRQELC